MTDTPDTSSQPPEPPPEPPKTGLLARVRAIWAKVPLKWQHYAAALVVALLTWLLTGKKDIPLPPIEFPHVEGWVDDQEAVQKTLTAIEKTQGFKPLFGVVAADAIAANTDDAVFLFEVLEKASGKPFLPWNQGKVGCCVSFGWGLGMQTAFAVQSVMKNEQFIPFDIATEPLYGGSRVQIGGGRIRGDGSVGAWAADFTVKYGNLFRTKYGSYDFSTYSEAMARKLGQIGCPKELEETAKEHPALSVALVKTESELWAAIGNGYPVPICSDVGFQSPIKNGFCARSGSWAHCMLIWGRFVDPKTKQHCYVVQNSWGDYLRSDGSNNALDAVGRAGKVILPKGGFAIRANEAAAIVSQGDSFAISGVKGFPANRIDWFVKNRQEKALFDPFFAIAP